jgi:hypothetical protein
MARLLIHDIDDTILSSADAMQHYFATEHGLTTELRLRDHHDIPKLYGIDVPTTIDLITQFQRSSHLVSMAPEPCALEMLPELHRQGFQFIAISASLEETSAVRKQHLEDTFGFRWEAVHCIGLKLCKREALMMYPASVWVDDLPQHTTAGAELGHRSFLLDRLHNSGEHHPAVTRVFDWHDIARHLLES